MALWSHTFDDSIETAQGIEKELPYEAEKLREMMLKLNKKGTEHLVDSIMHGALIQQAKTSKEQEGRILDYRKHILTQINNPGLRENVGEIHPALFGLATHTGLEGFFDIEEGNKNVFDLGILHNIFYAPMLYLHDGDEERKHEGAKILYGRKLCRKNFLGLRTNKIKNDALIDMIDAFDDNISEIPDDRVKEHYLQRKLVYEAFKDVLPENVRVRYLRSLSRQEY